MPEPTMLDRIRPLVADDLPRVLAWRNHERVRTYMFSRHLISAEENLRWFERESVDARKHLLVFERDGEPKGYVRFHVLVDGGTAEWGFYTSPDAPPGTGGKLGKAALDLAFDALGVHRVSGQVLGFNTTSLRFHERLGFTREGLLREQHFDGEAFQDVVCFGLLDREWRAHGGEAR